MEMQKWSICVDSLQVSRSSSVSINFYCKSMGNIPNGQKISPF